jgi:hypothetical protein
LGQHSARHKQPNWQHDEDDQHQRGRRAVSRTGPGGGGFVAEGSGGNVYAGHDGNVYRKNGDNWQQAGDGGWNDVQVPPRNRSRRRRTGQRRRKATLALATAAGRAPHQPRLQRWIVWSVMRPRARPLRNATRRGVRARRAATAAGRREEDTAAAAALGVPGAAEAAGAEYRAMEIIMRALSQIFERAEGPLSLRLFLQPLVASILAIRAGLNDAKAGQPPFLWTALSDPSARQRLFQSGWKDVSKVFVLASVFDCVYQFLVFGWVYPVQAVLVACLLAVVPYVILRGPVTRIAVFFRPAKKHPRSLNSLIYTSARRAYP